MNQVAGSEEEIGDTVLACEHKVWQAVIEKDGAAIAALFSDDYIEVTLDGKRVLKDAIVKESPEADEIEEYRIDSEQIVTLSDDSILLNYHLWLSGTCRGVPVIPQDRWATSVWKKVNASWQCSLFQQSHFVRPEPLADGGDKTIQIVPMTVEHVPAAIDLWQMTDGLILTLSLIHI